MTWMLFKVKSVLLQTASNQQQWQPADEKLHKWAETKLLKAMNVKSPSITVTSTSSAAGRSHVTTAVDDRGVSVSTSSSRG